MTKKQKTLIGRLADEHRATLLRSAYNDLKGVADLYGFDLKCADLRWRDCGEQFRWIWEREAG